MLWHVKKDKRLLKARQSKGGQHLWFTLEKENKAFTLDLAMLFIPFIRSSSSIFMYYQKIRASASITFSNLKMESASFVVQS